MTTPMTWPGCGAKFVRDNSAEDKTMTEQEQIRVLREVLQPFLTDPGAGMGHVHAARKALAATATTQPVAAPEPVESNEQIAARWECMMIEQRRDMANSKEPPHGWTGPYAAAISYKQSEYGEFGPWEPSHLGHGCVIVLRGDADKRVMFLFTAAPAQGTTDAVREAAKQARLQLKLWMRDHGQDIASQKAIKAIDDALRTTSTDKGEAA